MERSGALYSRVMFRVLNKLFDNNVRDVQQIVKTIVQPVNALEDEMSRVEDLAGAFMELRRRVQEGGETLDDVVVPAFALIREAGRRSIGKRHYDVQLIGGYALHKGRIAEMRTGEGKTLVATLALALNALEGRGCHLVTVNDYLARVGAEEMGLLYRTLGLTVGLASRELQPAQKQAAYACDITYVTNSELGFDYLRDNMAQSREALSLRAEHPLNFAIVDEVDSILIDEARTPLIISGAAEKATDLYYVYAKLIRRLQKGEPAEPGVRTEPTGDYTIDEKSKQVHMTENGIGKIERLLSIPDLFSPENMDKAHMITQAVRARELYHREKDYIINADGEVIIIDEFTGRSMPGRRYGEGLHQAIEAKEGVKIENENQTLATITYQNFFRLYTKFAGMTGTAKTEEKEFLDIYGSDVLGHSHQPRRDPQGLGRSGVPQQAGQVQRGGRGGPGDPHHGPPGPDRHRLHRDQRAAQRTADGRRHQALGAERQVRGPGGEHHRAGRAQRHGHHRHQHGRARHRHQAGRRRRIDHRGQHRVQPGPEPLCAGG